MKLFYTLLLIFSTGFLNAQHFSEDFSFFPNGWSIQSGPLSTATGVANWHSNSGVASIEKINDFVVHDEWLISPRFFIPSSPKTLLQFDFNASNFWMITPFDSADVIINVSTDSGATWVPVWNEDTAFFHSFQWMTEYVDISSFQNDSIQLGIQFTGRKGNSFGIDNLIIRDAPRHDLVAEDVLWYYEGSKDTIDYFRPFRDWGPLKFKALVTNRGWDSTTTCNVQLDIPGYSIAEDVALTPFRNSRWVHFSSTIPVNGSPLIISVNLTIDSDSIDAFPTNNLVADSIIPEYHWSMWDDRIQAKDPILGFLDAVDIDGDGFKDPYEILTKYEVPKGSDFTVGGLTFNAQAPVGQEVYHNVYVEDSVFYQAMWDGLSVPVPTYTINGGDSSTLANPVKVSVGGNPCAMHIQATDSLESYYNVLGFFWDSLHIGYSETSRHTFNKIVFFGTTVGMVEYDLRETPRIGDRVCWGSVAENQALTNVQIWPNPTSGITQLSINADTPGYAYMQIQSITGQIVQQRDLGHLTGRKKLYQIDLSNLPSGLYAYTVYLDNQPVSGKINVLR